MVTKPRLQIEQGMQLERDTSQEAEQISTDHKLSKTKKQIDEVEVPNTLQAKNQARCKRSTLNRRQKIEADIDKAQCSV